MAFLLFLKKLGVLCVSAVQIFIFGGEHDYVYRIRFITARRAA
jgi:hypothetical protein